ncbi:Thiol-specific monooxygenase [Cladobotryum mycophilum]|uniref:Thiol-specific monooxygenase n=1 Tax=Cladobotryum mycophilum TaxID=491253 RepID=A0ABR0SMD5_9HYPO
MGSVWSRPTPSSPSPPPKQFHVKRVAIIGAGPCGLVAAKYLKAQGTFESIVVFEQNAQVGGVWNYSNLTPKEFPVPQEDPFWGPEQSVWPGGDPAPTFPSPMYDNLHANLPGSLMNFTDQKFPDDAWVFPSRESIQEYLVHYAQDIRDLIKFRHQVTRVSLVQEHGRDQWHVENQDTTDGQAFNDIFDAVVVANGHYTIPYVPSIKNIAKFQQVHPSIITHSKQYRKSDHFKGKKVVVVGNGPSGLDVAMQINQAAGKTLLSVRHATPPHKLKHTGCEEIAEIDDFLIDQRGILLKDGSIVADIDHIVFCTGFLYGYPFLPDINHEIITIGRGVHGLYQHIFYIKNPTLVFPTLNMKSVPWPLSESQAAIFSSVWSNSLLLPPLKDMEKWARELEEKYGESLQVFEPRADGYYINELHEWAMQSSHRGKEPPRWDDEIFWQRSICDKAKIRFEEQGRKAKTLEELGFHYEPEEKGARQVIH